MENLYGILNSDGICVNTIVWDGESDWQPPYDTIVVQGEFKINYTYKKNKKSGEWIELSAPEIVQDQQLDLSVAEKLAAAGLTVDDLKTLLNLN